MPDIWVASGKHLRRQKVRLAGEVQQTVQSRCCRPKMPAVAHFVAEYTAGIVQLSLS
jgi:hypothetical protein